MKLLLLISCLSSLLLGTLSGAPRPFSTAPLHSVSGWHPAPTSFQFFGKVVVAKHSGCAPDPIFNIAPAAHPSFVVRVVGQGPPVLLLAGLGCSGRIWDATVARYSGSYQCHVVSLAGFAGNAPIAEPLLPAARRELLTYVRSQHLRRPIVIGHSLGGFLALMLAAEAPAQFGQVVVLDALPFGIAASQPALTEAQAAQALPTPAALSQQFAAMPAPQFAQLQRQLLAPAITDTARLRALLAERLASDPATLGRASAEMLRTDLRPLLPRLALPVWVLGADATARQLLQQPAALPTTCYQTYVTQYAGTPHLTLVMHPSAHHFLLDDAPAWCWQQLDQVLTRYRPVAAPHSSL